MKMLKEEKELHDKVLELCRWANVTPESYLGKIKALVRAVRADERKSMEKEGDAALQAAIRGK